MTPEELYDRNLAMVEKAWAKFRFPLSHEVYGLVPTDHISDVLLGQVTGFLALFNIVKNKPKTYLYAVQYHGLWYVLQPDGSVHAEPKFWAFVAFEKATPTVGYSHLLRDGSHWTEARVTP